MSVQVPQLFLNTSHACDTESASIVNLAPPPAHWEGGTVGTCA